MILRAGELLGVPQGVPDPALHAGLLRYLLLALALLWVLAAGRSRPGLSLLAGVTFVLAAEGFWVLALGRPYGLFLDAALTRRAADMSVAAAGAPPGQGFLVDVPPAAEAWIPAATWLRPAAWLLLWPTLLPLLVLPVLGVLVHSLWPRREDAPVAATLCLLFSTGDLDAARGVGFVPGLWAHPGSALLLLLIMAATLVLGRLAVREVVATGLGAAAMASWLVVHGASEGLGLADATLLLTLDQVPWCLLAAWGWPRLAPAGRALILGGAALVLLSALPLGIDGWGSESFYRFGLLLASAQPLSSLLRQAAAVLGRRRALAGFAPASLSPALLVLAGAPTCFLTWWTPTRTDRLMDESREPIAERLRTAMAWVRRETPSSSVFLASPDYAPEIAVLGGRRVLRAPTLLVADDDDRRDRAEDKVLRGRALGKLGGLYGLTHVFIAPGDFLSFGIAGPEELEKRGRFRLRYRDSSELRVYELE
ncbi:MAG: hypothetical protein DMF80_03495 [Acidobacteria bacterium]|nr:MAG: hypothetical protein DMF80_03495 [Acidobacteriota bacterium]PYQ24150.1 MAG: hypothetical protein DMF81_06455 [Acidobacteriota bacterium]